MVKYNSFIQDKCDGGFGLQDLEAGLTAQRVMWIKRLFSTDGKPWKYVCNFYLDFIGCINNVHSNFDVKVLRPSLPSFYHSCI